MSNLSRKPTHVILFILTLVCISCASHVAEGKDEMTSKKECSISDDLNISEIETFSLPSLDVQTLTNQNDNIPKDSPLRFAEAVEVEINPNSHGTWSSFDETIKIWRLRIVSPGSLSLNIGFTTFRMPEGGCLFLYSPDREYFLGPYTDQDNHEHGQLWTPSIEGEEVIIEVSIPTASIEQLKLVIGSINREFRR